jgi:hypothetical protein
VKSARPIESPRSARSDASSRLEKRPIGFCTRRRGRPWRGRFERPAGARWGGPHHRFDCQIRLVRVPP